LKIKYWLSIGLVGCKIEGEDILDDEEWNLMSEQEQDEYVHELAMNHVEHDYKVDE
jgi:hypothetical protein